LEAQEAFARLTQSLREKLANFQGIPPAPIDDDIAALLRPYQRTGADFLTWACSTMGGALLADDMGLGKTIQSIATITALRGRTEQRKPSLVVCPTSVVRNWARECGRFAPGLRVGVIERGDSRSDVLTRVADFDVVVINYALARIDVEKLAAHEWLLVIIDEAQAIKNAASQVAKALKRIRADHRIALTGTPIENRVGDLVSIMEFVAKGYLGSAAKYKPAQGPPTALDRQRLQLLRARLRPVLLRRLKSEVLQELPDRIEEQIDCALEGRQRTLYLAELKRARMLLSASKENNLAGTDRIQLLAALTRLRQLCCHPQLLGHEDVTSAKVESLLELLETLLAEGHKVLVFSQFVRFLNIVRTELESLNIPHWMLTGETTNRQQLVDEFQAAADPGVLHLSLKAGGTGLNLTAASHVVLLDPWWNPAVEAQAIDRSHRIGQTKTVVAFRLIMRETIEDRILELQEQKREIFRSIVEEEAFDRTLSKEDFAYLFAEIEE
jgi:SNF2 family DNA or RNA helicase